MDRDWKQLKDSLSHVYWIGGGPAAGKSTISKRLSDKFGFTRYDGDRHWLQRMKIATPHANPIGCRWWQSEKQGGSADWMWNRTGEEIANDYFEMARVEFESAVDDLLRLHDNPIVVDAYLAFPELVFKVAHPERAVFLVSTDEFQRESWTERMNEGHPTHKGFRDRMNTCSDPESALKNQIESSIIESKFMADDCARRGATLIVTGGRIDLEEAYVSVKKHFRLEG